MSGYNLGHVGFDHGSFELLVLDLGLDLGSMASSCFRSEFLFQASRTGPIRDDPKPKSEPRRLIILISRLLSKGASGMLAID